MKKCLLETKLIDWTKTFLGYFVSERIKPFVESAINEKQKRDNLKINAIFDEAIHYFKSIEECAEFETEQ